MSELKFTEDHEWIRVEGGVGTIGISDYAQEQLGDIVYVELPEVGKALDKSDELAVVESVKAASEIFAPVGGEIAEVNGALEDTPDLVNTSPTVDGWFVKLKIADPSELEELMSEADYGIYVKGLD